MATFAVAMPTRQMKLYIVLSRRNRKYGDMNMLDHFDSGQFARLVKESRVTTREQVLLSIVEKINWRTYNLHLSNSLHRAFAASAVALGCPLFYGFANFYVLAAHPHQASLERINRAKGRPPLQVGSITTTREHIPTLFDWRQLPKGLHKEQMLALIDAFYEMGPFGFRGPAANHIPDHLTSVAENGKRTTQLIASGYACPSNRFLQRALTHLEENYLFITSANISSHLTGQEEPAHYEMKQIQKAFERQKGILMMSHPNEEEARARYPQYDPMSTSILGFYELHTDDRGRPSLMIERHGSLPLDNIAEVLDDFGFGYVLGPKAQTRLAQQDYTQQSPGFLQAVSITAQ
jgi:tRNA A37 threonylcarbamoyladenosine synthetase subunit TsaC/SUA5/YrdC